MAFPPQEIRTPTSIGKVWHILLDDPGGPNTVRYVFEVLDQNGDLMRTMSGDEIPHIDAGDVTNLQAFVAVQRAKAEATLPS